MWTYTTEDWNGKDIIMFLINLRRFQKEECALCISNVHIGTWMNNIETGRNYEPTY